MDSPVDAKVLIGVLLVPVSPRMRIGGSDPARVPEITFSFSAKRHLRRILARYFQYYHQSRTHLSLDKDAPDVRSSRLSEVGRIVELPEVGGLHHRYVRRAA